VFSSGDDDPLKPPLSWLVDLHRTLLPAHEPAPVTWPLRRAAGAPWSVQIAVSHDSERAEAMGNLAAALGMAALGSLALLLAMHARCARCRRCPTASCRRLPPRCASWPTRSNAPSASGAR
jgi:hypothetical protein